MSEASTTIDLPAARRTVLRGVARGIVLLALLCGGGYAWLPPLVGYDVIDRRLELAVRCAVLPTVMLLLGIGAVGNGRAMSEAIDPLAGKESPRMIIHGRYVDNTTQQLLLFLTADFGLAIHLSTPMLRMLPVLCASFVIGRALFWIGYLKHPLYRAPGLAMTLYPTALSLLWLSWRVVSDALR